MSWLGTGSANPCSEEPKFKSDSLDCLKLHVLFFFKKQLLVNDSFEVLLHWFYLERPINITNQFICGKQATKDPM